MPETPGLRPWRRSTQPWRECIYRDHHEGICALALARLRDLGNASVGRIYAEFTSRKASERQSLECPRILGIDEHRVHRGMPFATTFCDLRNHRIFDLVPGRSEPELRGFLAALKGREKVQVICMDLSSPYRALARRGFPHARIVADRFHVICLLQSQLALRAIYDKILELWELLRLKHQTARACRGHIRHLIALVDELRLSAFEPLVRLAKTLHSWRDALVTMWRFTKNNGLTEGFHRKMKFIQRRAYGFRNFHNYRGRIIAQCG